MMTKRKKKKKEDDSADDVFRGIDEGEDGDDPDEADDDAAEPKGTCKKPAARKPRQKKTAKDSSKKEKSKTKSKGKKKNDGAEDDSPFDHAMQEMSLKDVAMMAENGSTDAVSLQPKEDWVCSLVWLLRYTVSHKCCWFQCQIKFFLEQDDEDSQKTLRLDDFHDKDDQDCPKKLIPLQSFQYFPILSNTFQYFPILSNTFHLFWGTWPTTVGLSLNWLTWLELFTLRYCSFCFFWLLSVQSYRPTVPTHNPRTKIRTSLALHLPVHQWRHRAEPVWRHPRTESV